MAPIVSICSQGYVALECACPEPHHEIRVAPCVHQDHEGKERIDMCTCAWRSYGIKGAHHDIGCPKAVDPEGEIDVPF